MDNGLAAFSSYAVGRTARSSPVSFHLSVVSILMEEFHFHACTLLLFQEKFSRMTLAFKTDQQTLNKRIELHLRSKELAACNIQKELEGLRAELQVSRNLPSYFNLPRYILAQNAGRLTDCVIWWKKSAEIYSNPHTRYPIIIYCSLYLYIPAV